MNRPFDAKRYKRLLEGLDAAETKWSALERTKRVDSEFFSKRHLRVSELLRHVRSEDIASLAAVSDGNHFSIADQFVEEDGIPYYRGQDGVGHAFIEQSNPRLISQRAFQQPYMSRSHLRKGDVLLTIVGTIGESALVTSDEPATCSCKLAILRPRSVPSGYLAAFLRSELGRSQTERYTRGAVQMGLPLEDMDQIRVARLSANIEKRIAVVVEKARLRVASASENLAQAEAELVAALGLADWQPPQPLSYTRRALQTFAAARLDAEAFDPKYDAIIDLMHQNPHEFELVPLRELSASLKYGCSTQLRYVKSGRAFLRIADLENKRFSIGSVLRVSEEIEFRESELVRQNDVLVSRSGTLGVAVPIPYELTGAAYGSYFIRTRPDTDIVHPEYLALVLNSLVGRTQVEGKTTGGVQTNLTIPAIESMMIPIGSLDWQSQFVALVERSQVARHRARELLAAAQRAVEIAIEQDEAAALAYLDSFGSSS